MGHKDPCEAPPARKKKNHTGKKKTWQTLFKIFIGWSTFWVSFIHSFLFFFFFNIGSNETRMKTSLLLGCILCLVSLSQARDIKMGIFLPFTGSWPGGPKMASAILIAMDKVNDDPYWLPGHNLTYVLKDSKCEAKSSLAHLVDYYTLESPKVDVYIGPGCSVACVPGAYIAAHWNIPMISWGCTASVLSDKTLYPYFVRTAGTYTGLGDLLRAFLTQYKWDRIGIMASTETVFSEIANTAKVTLEKDGKFQVPFFGSFDPGATDLYKLKSMVRSMASKARGKSTLFSLTFAILRGN